MTRYRSDMIEKPKIRSGRLISGGRNRLAARLAKSKAVIAARKKRAPTTYQFQRNRSDAVLKAKAKEKAMVGRGKPRRDFNADRDVPKSQQSSRRRPKFNADRDIPKSQQGGGRNRLRRGVRRSSPGDRRSATAKARQITRQTMLQARKKRRELRSRRGYNPRRPSSYGSKAKAAAAQRRRRPTKSRRARSRVRRRTNRRK